MAPAMASNPFPSAAVPIVDPTSARRPVEPVQVQSDNVTYTREHITAQYTHHKSQVVKGSDGSYRVQPVEQVYEFKTERKVPKTG
jgi:myo-inositol-1-phosphate synthase